jgi:hypothetical protein
MKPGGPEKSFSLGLYTIHFVSTYLFLSDNSPRNASCLLYRDRSGSYDAEKEAENYVSKKYQT